MYKEFWCRIEMQMENKGKKTGQSVGDKLTMLFDERMVGQTSCLVIKNQCWEYECPI